MAYDIFDIPPKAPYLALLGDIGYASHPQHREAYLGFLRRQLSKFRVVFLVLGNHEPWHGSWEASRETMRQFAEVVRRERNGINNRSRNDDDDDDDDDRNSEGGRLGKFVFLDRTRYDVNSSSESPGEGEDGNHSLTILGCTLFSRVPAAAAEAVSFGVNDFYHIDGWTVEQHDARFRGDVEWLNEQVAALDAAGRRKNVVVLTHYSPTLDQRAVDPRHRDSPIQAGFASDLSGEPCWSSGSVKVWAFGHTHFNCDFVDEETGKRVVANQRGYYFGQSGGFVPDKIVEI